MAHEKWWMDLWPLEREVHFNRVNKCPHKYQYDVPNYDELREPYSFDPYAHTAHMLPHDKDNKKCDCQMCANKIGQMRVKAV